MNADQLWEWPECGETGVLLSVQSDSRTKPPGTRGVRGRKSGVLVTRSEICLCSCAFVEMAGAGHRVVRSF